MPGHKYDYREQSNPTDHFFEQLIIMHFSPLLSKLIMTICLFLPLLTITLVYPVTTKQILKNNEKKK